MEQLEKMADFFSQRADMYDSHMLNEVEGCKEGYELIPQLLPQAANSLLDLGCGTGLELDGIFARFPDISVTGIDLCEAMLIKLKEKYSSKDIRLICGDYFTLNAEEELYDSAVSFQTMHHFEKQAKLSLYKKIYSAIKKGGVYIEGDYMVLTDEEEEHWFSESRRIRKALGILDGEFYHYDTPCSVKNQLELLEKAGFKNVRQVFRMENTTVIVGEKQ
ncbi:MAG: class I SAM-dependent methyltransferase [Clostridia bacterium]|nr:class I SAM-dependent methyltransferase [Clostridia bacterium]